MDANLFGVKDIPELVARLKVHAASVPAGAWIVGFGYQAKAMGEGRTPTALELDGVSLDRPVMIVDSSGHLGSANNALLKLAGVTAATADPTGGAFARQSGSREPLGPMEETALNAVRSQRPAFTGKLADDAILAGAAAWARFGQTTAQDCGIGLGAITKPIDHMAELAQAARQRLAQRGVVFDDQQVHGTRWPGRARSRRCSPRGRS
jgi:predicted amidohydrolase YtcJ